MICSTSSASPAAPAATHVQRLQRVSGAGVTSGCQVLELCAHLSDHDIVQRRTWHPVDRSATSLTDAAPRPVMR